jgi:N-methylhydantoinase A
MVLSSHGADPRTLAMIAYGGNGAVHAWAQAEELGIRRVLIPKAAPAFSALGLLVADYLVDLVRAYVVPLSQVDVKRVNQLMADLVDEATKELGPANLSADQQTFELFAQMCYPGQNFDMSVPLVEGRALTDEDLLDLAARFHDLHESSRGFAFRGQQPLLRGLRCAAGGRTPKPARLAVLGGITDANRALTHHRPVFFGGGFVDTPVYDGNHLAAGATIAGPGLIEEPFTVVVVPPGHHARLDEHGNYNVGAG